MNRKPSSPIRRGLSCGRGLAIVVWMLAGMVEASPPFPWRARNAGPTPLVQRPLSPTAPANRSQRPLPLVPPEPTLADPAADTVPRTRTYFTARRPAALYPSGNGIHVAVSEKFLDELIRVESQAAGPVKDCILGAEVLGSQQTETAVHVRLVPNDDVAQFDLQLTGMTRNSTENRTPQAVIQSEGNHRFEVTKSVQFDGKQILTRSPSAMMYPCQQNRSALTPASAIPILGPLVSEYALGVAEQQRPEAERITAQRITEQVVPQFNDAIDKRLATLNGQLTESLPKLLPQLGIMVPTTRVRTTDDLLTVNLGWEETRSLPEYTPTAFTLDAAELRVAFHSEAVNIWLESLPLGGLEIPVDHLDRWQKELQRVLAAQQPERGRRSSTSQVSRVGRIRSQLASDENGLIPGLGAPTIIGPILPQPSGPTERVDKVPTFAEPESEPAPGSDSNALGQTLIILADKSPITVEFGPNEATITLVAAFRIALAPQTDFHRIRIPVTSQLLSDELVVTVGAVTVETTSSQTGPLTELMRSTIEKQVQQRLQPTHWPVEREWKREQGNPVRLRLGELSSGSGWLSFLWNVQSAVEPSSTVRPSP